MCFNLSRKLVLYVEPSLCSLGILINLICISIFFTIQSNGYFRKASFLIMIVSLCFCSCCQLLLSIFVIILPAAEQFMQTPEYEHTLKALQLWNSHTVPVGYPLLMTANYSSIWIITLMCAQRWQAVCPPNNPWKHKLIFLKNSKRCILVAVVIAFLVNIIRFWETEWDGTNLVKSNLYNDVYISIMEGVIYGTFVYLLPLVLLFWFNINNLILANTSEIKSRRSSAEYRTIIMTFVIFIFFFVFTTLSATLRLIMIFSKVYFSDTIFECLMDINNVLMNSNAFVVPIICIIFTRGFRDLFFVIRHAKGNNEDPYAPVASKLNKRLKLIEEPKESFTMTLMCCTSNKERKTNCCGNLKNNRRNKALSGDTKIIESTQMTMNTKQDTYTMIECTESTHV
uniref:G_PROTEIN_RECEP_F1_2 domain-containing protein n=1 Tax=Rhabditophanes sp. KR3021 TaxID=114890 RepID=A0AC35U863_9BILA